MAESSVLTLPLRRQTADNDTSGFRVWRPLTSEARWPAAATALLLCDIWDRHWCPAAEVRLEHMLPRMQQVVTVLRERGVQIVHAPSETMPFYEQSPARRRVLAAPTVAPPSDAAHDDPPLPFATPGGGCDAPGATSHKTWSRQHPGIQIDETADAISDNGRELYSFYRQRGITHILLMGVHTNMCVLHRSFAIKQMVRWGFDVALIRDLTDAMYDPASPPYVSHAEGTRLVVEFIEKFWCPTVESIKFTLPPLEPPTRRSLE